MSSWRLPGFTELRELGSGASGRVVMARQDSDGRLVAIKYLSDTLKTDMDFVARFRHEAQVLQMVDSPQVARLYQYTETAEGAAIVMELVDGAPLRALIRAQGPTGPEAALVVLKGALLGLAAAHAAGVVHRDFKPENVIVCEDGTSKLVDFGVAVPVGVGDGTAGTPPYMAPEQWSGASATPSTDVYAATVVFFECLTGARPFRSPNIASLAHEHQSVPPPVQEVPAPLQSLVEQGLAKRPVERPPSAEAFLSELERIAGRAYGPEWEHRGRRRLAALAGLLALHFPQADLLPGTETAVAETRLGGLADKPLIGRLGVKIAVGIGCVGIGVLGFTVIDLRGEPELRAQSSEVTPGPSRSPAQLGLPSQDPEGEVEEPAEEPPASVDAEPPPITTEERNTAAPPAKPSRRPARPSRGPAPTRTADAEPPPEPVPSIDFGRPDRPDDPETSAPPPTVQPPPTFSPRPRPPRPNPEPPPPTPPATPTFRIGVNEAGACVQPC